jgi:hypothetical protein
LLWIWGKYRILTFLECKALVWIVVKVEQISRVKSIPNTKNMLRSSEAGTDLSQLRRALRIIALDYVVFIDTGVH